MRFIVTTIQEVPSSAPHQEAVGVGVVIEGVGAGRAQVVQQFFATLNDVLKDGRISGIGEWARLGMATQSLLDAGSPGGRIPSQFNPF